MCVWLTQKSIFKSITNFERLEFMYVIYFFCWQVKDYTATTINGLFCVLGVTYLTPNDRDDDDGHYRLICVFSNKSQTQIVVVKFKLKNITYYLFSLSATFGSVLFYLFLFSYIFSSFEWISPTFFFLILIWFYLLCKFLMCLNEWSCFVCLLQFGHNSEFALITYFTNIYCLV